MTKQLFLLRGLPGAGKSALASLFKSMNAEVVCMDDFFTEHGEYCYDATKIGRAIDWCHSRFKFFLAKDCQTVIVDGTHSREMEYRWYVEMATTWGYEVHIIHVEAPLHDCIRRQKHKVPISKILEFRDRWEPVSAATPEGRLSALEAAIYKALS